MLKKVNIKHYSATAQSYNILLLGACAYVELDIFFFIIDNIVLNIWSVWLQRTRMNAFQKERNPRDPRDPRDPSWHKNRFVTLCMHLIFRSEATSTDYSVRPSVKKKRRINSDF